MGFFDFLKKNEFEQIDNLSEQVSNLKEQIRSLDLHITSLSRFENINNLASEESAFLQRIEGLKKSYQASKAIYDSLQSKIELFNDSLSLSEYGVYEPHFDFDSSEKFKQEILKIRYAQKEFIKADIAAKTWGTYSLNGSVSEGKKLITGQKKIMLRAFNGECDSFIASADWNNITKMQERIAKSFRFINDIFELQQIAISDNYYDLKIKELQLTYEYRKKKHDEKEEQRAIREQMREEEKAAREIEQAMRKAEKEEITFQKALEKARAEILGADEDEQQKLQLKIAELETRLQEAGDNRERALSMAQQTRRGHVYVISNIGSFGENIYKIGMTRRLDPIDRVRELGDASVPYAFDVHALIFTEDAPALELALHKAFENKRVNMINQRREFFCVTLEEIEQIVLEKHGQIEFTKIAEAEEFRESTAIRNRIVANSNTKKDFSNLFNLQ